MSDNLKACPSCGPGTRVEEFIPMPGTYGDFVAVICRGCGMRGPRDTWNVRPPDADRLRGAIADVLNHHVVDAEARVKLRAALDAAPPPGRETGA